MGLLEETLKGKSLADYTNTQLRLALGAVLYTNTADMWKQYLNQMGYSGDVSQMLQKYYVDYAVPFNFRNYINAGAAIYSPQQLFLSGAKGSVYDASDLSTLYLDAALTTPATVNGLVGGQKDKSGNGLHRTQSTTGSKPILRGSPVGANTVSNPNFDTDTLWSKGSGWTIGSGVATATAATGNLSATMATAVVASRFYRVTYTITRTAGSVTPNIGGTSGTARSASGTYVEWIQATNTGAFVLTVSTFSGTVDNVEIVDVSAGQVQAPYFLQYDGVDDFLLTAAVDFTATDKMFVCAGVQNDGTATAVVIELSASSASTNGTFALFSNNIGAGNMMWGIRNTVSGDEYLYYSNGTNPSKGVLSASMDINNATKNSRIIGRKNGVVQGATYGGVGTTTGGNFGSHILYFGRRSGASLPYNGLESRTVICGKTLSATELASTERWVAQGTGVTF